MEIKNKIAEIITQTHKTPFEQAEEIVQLFAENNDYKQLLQSRVSGQSELSCGGNCGMNYCDTNGCMDRKRILTEPKPPEDSH